MNNLTKVFVGVDVSKDFLDVFVSEVNKYVKIKNNSLGFKKLIKLLSVYQVACIACEYTGGYEAKMVKAVKDAGYQTWSIDPVRIKGFIKSEGIKAKTDNMDAKMIALFASQKQQAYIPLHASESELKLKALVKAKEALTADIARIKTRSKKPLADDYCLLLDRDIIQFMEKQKLLIEEKITSFIATDKEWQNKASIIESIPGVGKASASVLISHMPELGTLDNKKIAALLGVAPYTKQSGHYVGKATIYAGRSTPRLILYMATLTGVRCNPVLKKFYQRLKLCGKPSKVALIAAMRKLICIINSMLKNQTFWKTA